MCVYMSVYTFQEKYGDDNNYENVTERDSLYDTPRQSSNDSCEAIMSGVDEIYDVPYDHIDVQGRRIRHQSASRYNHITHVLTDSKIIGGERGLDFSYNASSDTGVERHAAREVFLGGGNTNGDQYNVINTECEYDVPSDEHVYFNEFSDHGQADC